MNTNQALRAEHLLHNSIDVMLDLETQAKQKHRAEGGGKYADRERARDEERSGEMSR